MHAASLRPVRIQTDATRWIEDLGLPVAIFSTRGERLWASTSARRLDLEFGPGIWTTVGEALLRSGHDYSRGHSERGQLPVPFTIRTASDHPDTLWVIFYPSHNAAPSPPAPIPDQSAKAEVGLTAREREVARSIASGRSIREAATDLCMSIHTARRHTERIYQKLGIKNRVHLARMNF